MLGKILPIWWVVENLAIDNKNMAILWRKNYGVVELWVHVKWPIIHKEWRGSCFTWAMGMCENLLSIYKTMLQNPHDQ
jgi:hypothetical protein